MARYEHLPIYRDALNLAVHFEKIVASFSRYHKYTLGSELRNASRKAVTLIIQANNQSDKQQALRVLRDHLEELLLLVRIAKEAQAFKSFNAYSHVVELTAKVCRQNEGWLKNQSQSPQKKPDKSARMS
ncbi:four helix bundle protein [Methylomonas sp. AM2-LC]|jgi:hypothetical protein|uniref:four helix bundle protein n=1 Tax=Methylomonas sp. AM2-LC TaxID=3153301 RepID=UPI003262D9E7